MSRLEGMFSTVDVLPDELLDAPQVIDKLYYAGGVFKSTIRKRATMDDEEPWIFWSDTDEQV